MPSRRATFRFCGRRRARCLSVSISGLLMVPSWPFAAEAPITPGAVQSTVESGKPQLPATPAQVILPVQSAPSQHDPRAMRFVVHGFDIAGNTVFRDQSLKRLLDRFMDQQLNLYDLNRAADVITEFYHGRGYLLARAVIPAQKVTKGVVRIRIVEGRMGKVTFSGNKRHSVVFLSDRTPLLTPGSLVTTDKLEKELLLLNDIPGLSAKAVLSPGDQFGDTNAEIGVTEKLFSGSVNLNNHGRAETGQNRLEATANLNSPFGWGDQLSLSGSSTQHKLVRYWKTAYSLPLNTSGTRLSVDSSKTEYEVSGALSALGITGEVRTTNLTVTHPFERSRKDSSWLTVQVKHNRLAQNALGTPISDSSLKVLNTVYQISNVNEDSSVTNASFGFETNFKKVERVDQQDAVFARMELDVSHTTPFVKQWDLHLRGNIVRSNAMLPDTEKFSLGGPDSVRGFRPSEVRGDSGYLATAELRHPFKLAGRMGSVRVTADVGEANYKMPGFSDSRDRLRSAGVGASFYPASGVVVSFDLAKPIGAYTGKNEGRNHRVWASISANF